MIKAKKGLLIALFAAMMVFAFGATSAFASTIPAADADGDTLYDGTVQEIQWDEENCQYGVVNVQKVDSTDTRSYQFDYMTPTQLATYTANNHPTDDAYLFVLTSDEALTPIVSGSPILVETREMEIYKYFSETRTWKRVNYTNGWNTSRNNPEETPNFHWASFTDEVKVIDINDQTIRNGNGGAIVTTVDAGNYSAWLALKDDETEAYPYEQARLKSLAEDNWEVGYVFANTDDYAEMWSAEYGDYAAYSYDTEGSIKKDKKVNITITPNVDAIKAWIGKMSLQNIVVLPTPKVIELTATVTGFNNPSAGFYDGVAPLYWNDWAVAGAKTYYDADEEPLYTGWTYDGTAHAVAFKNIPAAVTVKYAAFKYGAKLADGTKVDYGTDAEDLGDADWADAAEIKDAGEYLVFVKMTLDKYPTNTSKVFFDEDIITVKQFPVALGFKQIKLQTEYGKYTKESLEAAIKDFVVFSNNTPDSQDKIAEAVTKYCLVGGLFTDAGESYVVAKIDADALAKDTVLSAALANYDIYSGSDIYNGVPSGTLDLIIEKITNTVDFEAVAKTYKAKALKKKAKKFQLNATATYGDVKYAKISGSAKVKVSKTGKVTVKKGTKKGTYKVKVKAYVDGTANYSAASQTAKIVIKVKK